MWCVGFAAVNLAYLATGHFDDGEYAEYAAGIAGMSWMVLIIKLVGAAVALMAVYRVPRFCSPRVLGLTLWGAAALLVLYSAGNLVQLAGMLTGVMGSREDITLLGLGYVAFFMLGAVGYGMLAVSFSRRYSLTKPTAILGVLGAPLFLAVILVPHLPGCCSPSLTCCRASRDHQASGREPRLTAGIVRAARTGKARSTGWPRRATAATSKTTAATD